jgi:hypothetical protein
MLDCMNVSETDWKACQMIDQTAKQALPSHRPNGFTHGTHGPGRLQGNAQVPYSLSFTDLAVSTLCWATGLFTCSVVDAFYVVEMFCSFSDHPSSGTHVFTSSGIASPSRGKVECRASGRAALRF